MQMRPREMSDTTRRAAAALAICLLPLIACDLDVENPNDPDRRRALSNPADVESLIRSQFLQFWGVVQGDITDEGNPGPSFDAAAEVETSNSFNDGTFDQGLMPPIAIINRVGYRWGNWMRDPWLNFNRGLASIRDGLRAVEEQNLRIAEPERLQAFAKFMQGLFHGWIALQYDRGFILDETVEEPGSSVDDLRPYDEVMEAARGYLAEARAIAGANDFALPDGWLGPDSYTSDDLVRLAHSYEARFMASVARTPEERAAVSWSEVLDHVNRGVVEDFGINAQGPGGLWTADYKGRSARTSSVYLPLIGPADQSGAYTEWENASPEARQPFLVDTDDRRITAGPPNSSGKYLEFRDFFNNQSQRGTFFLSNYSPKWWREISDTEFGFAPEVSVKEMNFLAAEAHIRMGNPQAALPLINQGRVENGELPPATAQGVSGERCVPRAVGPIRKISGLPQGACGDLLTTLAYEKRIELFEMSAGLSFFDARGWGMLRTGRPLHVPIPMEDIQVISGLEFYTFGGGGPGSAP